MMKRLPALAGASLALALLTAPAMAQTPPAPPASAPVPSEQDRLAVQVFRLMLEGFDIRAAFAPQIAEAEASVCALGSPQMCGQWFREAVSEALDASIADTSAKLGAQLAPKLTVKQLRKAVAFLSRPDVARGFAYMMSKGPAAPEVIPFYDAMDEFKMTDDDGAAFERATSEVEFGHDFDQTGESFGRDVLRRFNAKAEAAEAARPAATG